MGSISRSTAPLDASSGPPGRHQRKLRNLLLDKKFQLKYTGYLVAIAATLSLSLGLVLWQTSAQLIEQSAKSAQQGTQIVELGKEVVGESRKVSAVVRMNIVKDPIYQDDPDLLSAFNSDADDQDKRLDAQRAKLEEQRIALERQAQSLQEFHRTMLWSLAGVLGLLVVSIGLAGIFVTHKVAGPIYKMKRHLKEVARGKLEVPWGLRKGDELVHFFDAFRRMVASLRTEREGHIKRLNAVVSELGESVPDEKLVPLRELRDDLQKALS